MADSEDKPSSTELDVRLSTSVWSGDRQLNYETGVFYPQVNIKMMHKLPSGVNLVAEGYAGQEYGLSSGRSRAALKEAYMSVKQDRALTRLGWQIVSWGRADVVNPTDNVAAYDYTLLVPSDAEQKLGVLSANVTYRLDTASVQAIWQPAFRGSQIPLPQVSGSEYVERKPEGLQDSGGVRYDVTGDHLAWSVSYFRGPSKPPNLALEPARVAQGFLDTNHPDVATYGVDLEYLAGHWLVRGEAAYNDIEGSGETLLASRESFALAVLGVERDFGDASGFLQMTYRRIFDFVDPYQAPPQLINLALANAVVNNEARESLFGLGAGFTYNTSDFRWSVSADLAYFMVNNDFALRPRIRYQLNDAVSLWAGGDYFTGVDTGQLGRLEKNTAAFIGVTISRLTQW